MSKYNEKRIVLFGASLFCKRIITFFIENDFIIDAIFDNDSEKWGKEINGIKIKNPKKIDEYKSNLCIITSMYFNEIKEQIQKKNNGIKIINTYDFIFKYMDKIEFEKIERQNKIKEKNKIKLILGAPNDLNEIGGVETWTVKTREILEDKFEIEIFNLNSFFENSNGYVNKIIKYIRIYGKENKIIIFPNLCEELYIIGSILKKIYKEKVIIISTLHSNLKETYAQHIRYKDYIDQFICVSKEIEEVLEMKINKSDVCISTIISGVNIIKNTKFNLKKMDKEIIDIVFIGRLEITDKRVDKLCILYDALNKLEIKFKLNIVGEGSFRGTLEEKLNFENVQFLGKVENEVVQNILDEMDIFINVSDMEGTSIAMLEALAKGLTPVVTDVSGIDEFIKHEKNGYVVQCDDMNNMAACIKTIYDDRTILYKNYDYNRKLILDKCSEEVYKDKLTGIINNLINGEEND